MGQQAGQRMRSADKLLEMVAEDSKLQADLKEKPLETLVKATAVAKKEIPEVYRTDKVFYRIVVIGLAVVVFASVIGAIVITTEDRDVPAVLVALGSAAVGALAGIFAQPTKAE